MSGSANRDRERSPPGHCPKCDVSIPSSNVLIEYEAGEGTHRMFAECPDCRDVIHPSERHRQ